MSEPEPAPRPAQEPAPRVLGPWGLALVRGAWSGAAAGILVAAWDVASSGRLIGTFVRGGARVTHFVFVAALYALMGLLFGAALALAGRGYWVGTHVGALVRRVRAAVAARREADPLVATIVTAQVLALLALLGVAWLMIWRLAWGFQLKFHVPSLIGSYIGAVAVAAVLGALLAAQVAARLLELGLRAAARGPLRRPLASPWCAAALAGGVVLAMVVVAIAIGRHNSTLLWRAPQLGIDLRRMTGIALMFVLYGAYLILLSHKITARLWRRLPGRLTWIATLLAVPLLFSLVVWLGGSGQLRNATEGPSALGGYYLRALRWTIDFDRDGYSPILGGGDCNDFDARIHPGAYDIPDNGIDENCIGGDFSPRALGISQPFTALPPAAPAGPNILLITIDTVRADHFGVYGYGRPTTPNIDALARSGTLFENGYADAPSTRYSMPAIMAGRWPSTVRWDSACPFTGGCATAWPPPVSDQNRMLAEALQDHGYLTAAYLSFRFFVPTWGLAQGFTIYDNSRENLHQGERPEESHGSSSREQADVAIQFLHEHGTQRFFLWVHFYDPHYFYEGHPEVTQFGTSPMDLYDEEIAFTDLHVGRVLAELEALGLADKTVVALTGDHGEGFGEHEIKFHGYHLYTAQTKVPFIIRAPGFAPRRVREPVSHVDLMPTLLNLAGAPPEPGALGRSAVDLMAGVAPPPGSPPRGAFQEVLFEGPVTRKALATADWHLIYNMVPSGTYELYHTADDPLEAHDLSGQGGDAAAAFAELKERLDRWIDVTAQLTRPGGGP